VFQISYSAEWGDVNSSGGIDIVDALLVAQYSVGLYPQNFDQSVADVDGNGTVTIVDALQIARFSVGLIDHFPVSTVTQAPTPVPNPTPVPTPITGNQETLNDCPSNYRSALDWIWTNRIVKEGSTNRRNLIFDQIYAGNGELHYCVRWQSSLSVTLQQRQEIASMISRQIKNWTRHLANYDRWPYNDVAVIVVSWACVNPSLLQNLQSNEIVYTDWTNDPLHNEDSSIPIQLPAGPTTCSRFDHFTDSNYSYSSCPGGPQNRFDMYLWGTTNFNGGAGGGTGDSVWVTVIS
jgi:hypothetical protein